MSLNGKNINELGINERIDTDKYYVTETGYIFKKETIILRKREHKYTQLRRMNYEILREKKIINKVRTQQLRIKDDNPYDKLKCSRIRYYNRIQCDLIIAFLKRTNKFLDSLVIGNEVGLSSTRASEYCSFLRNQGVLESVTVQTNKRGRPPVLYKFKKDVDLEYTRFDRDKPCFFK